MFRLRPQPLLAYAQFDISEPLVAKLLLGQFLKHGIAR